MLFTFVRSEALKDEAIPHDEHKLLDRYKLHDAVTAGLKPFAQWPHHGGLLVPKCDRLFVTKDRYMDVPIKGKRFFLAMNAYNNGRVLPTIFREMIDLVAILTNRGADSVFVSIVENGSEDEGPAMLAAFRGLLDDFEIPNLIITDSTPTDWFNVNRIVQLAAHRNKALEPMYNAEKSYDRVIFYNDVFHCSEEVMELLYQLETQGADMVCPLDWWEERKAVSTPYPLIWDMWVMRTMQGQMCYPMWERYSFSKDPDLLFRDDPITQWRFRERRPFQVFSCWNGLVVMDAAPFYEHDGVDPVRFRAGNVSAGECQASECELVCRDFWSHGFGKIAVIPRVGVWYDLQPYLDMRSLPVERIEDTGVFPHELPIANKLKEEGGHPLWDGREWFGKPFPPKDVEKIWWMKKPPQTSWCLPHQGGVGGKDWDTWRNAYLDEMVELDHLR
ncbi:hypothetical protein SAICODRAFT_31929 [Saitoella complicata NRRL Y-17804]|nr:uncharacterized protein SAICODRAFT_31929 [Saitoella complicata NRRL Y-17804]ODQ50383.1 hypothetical protein SAICODRAFT_31929 [Saitoella complicata NRRL Y-17804]